MENNQQSKKESGTSNNNVAFPFSNQQPGQQLPTENNQNKMDHPSSNNPEQHSESSLPANDNETLGTP
jgi:oligoendopeptidase F